MTAGWRRWLRIFGRDPQRDVDAELRFHMEARIDDLVARGAASEAARAQALAEFGDLDAMRERLGAIDARIAQRNRRADWWEGIAQDFRHTLRGLARSPGFTVMVVVTLALGIGANAAVFSVLDRLFLQYPPGVMRPAEVHGFEVHTTNRRTGAAQLRDLVTYPEYKGLAAAMPGTPLAGWQRDPEHLGTGPNALAVNAMAVVGDYFGVLGVRAARGRVFESDEWQVGTLTPVAVISDATWHARFGGQPDILGKTITLGVHAYTIIGVTPPGFHGTDLNTADVWVPLNSEGSWTAYRPEPLAAWASITPLVRVADSRAAARVIGEATPVFRQSRMARDSLATVTLPGSMGASPSFTGDGGRIATRLAGVAVIILLLACANVANLLLTRGMQRRRETAIRLALGISRHRLVGQLLSESVVMAVIAGATALLVAVWSAAALRHALLPNIAWGTPAVGANVVAFTAAVAALAALIAGVIPAFQSARPDVNAALKSDRLGGSSSRSRTRAALTMVQAGLAVVLLGGAGLFVRSLHAVKGIDIGYDTNNMIVASARFDVDAAPTGGPPASELLVQVAKRAEALPGVASVGVSASPPMESINLTTLHLPGTDSVPSLGGAPPLTQFVSPGFFKASGIALLAGRRFTDADRDGAEPVVIVSQSMAHNFWPRGAVGQCVIVGKPADPCRRVVGVVSDEHVVNIVEREYMQLFIPLAQSPNGERPGEVVIGAAPGQVDAVVRETRHAVMDIFGTGAIPKVEAMRDVLDPQFQPWRLGAILFSGAGLLALLVAAIGVYSTMSYGVSLRRREIGIRMALGARRQGIARLIVGQGVRVVSLGILLGVVAAIALGRLVVSLLYGVSPHDPLVLTATAAALLAVTFVACLAPAWRATRVDPMEILRSE